MELIFLISVILQSGLMLCCSMECISVKLKHIFCDNFFYIKIIVRLTYLLCLSYSDNHPIHSNTDQDFVMLIYCINCCVDILYE